MPCVYSIMTESIAIAGLQWQRPVPSGREPECFLAEAKAEVKPERETARGWRQWLKAGTVLAPRFSR